MNLTTLLSEAAGGRAFDALSQRFGLDLEQIQSMAGAILPTLSQGLQRLMGSGDGLGQIAALLQSNDASDAIDGADDPAAAADAPGAQLLSALFGDRQDAVMDAMAEDAGARAGVPAETARGAIPAFGGLVLSGLQSRESGDSALSELLSSVSGGSGLAGMAGGALGALGLGGGGSDGPDLSALSGLFASGDDDADSSADGLLGRLLG